MYVKQISVFIENTPGKLAELTKLLGDSNIDLVSISIADTTQFGILRGITADYEKAAQVVEKAGYTTRLTDVIAAAVSDKPGGLAEVLKFLCDDNVNVDYMYSFIRNAGNNAVIIFRVEELERAAAVLNKHGVKLLTQEEIFAL